MKLGQVAKVAKGDWYIIPRYNEWLYERRRKGGMEAERDTLMGLLTRPERVRTGTFSASGAGQCLRRRQLAFLGYKQVSPPERTMNIFANGDYVHLRHQVAGLLKGYLTGAEVSVSNEEYGLTGTMDGELDDGGIFEAKSINSRGFSDVGAFGVKTEHSEQVHSYFLASGKSHARVLYENKDTNELKEFVVHRNESTIKKVRGDLEILQDATHAETLLPMQGECVEGKGAYTSCPFRESCPLASFVSPRRSIRVRSSTASD